MTLTHVYEIKNALQPRVCWDLFDCEIAPYFIIYIGGYKLVTMDYTGNLNDVHMALFSINPNHFSGVAVLNHEIELNDDKVTIQCDLMCDIAPPKTKIFINGCFEYNSDTFTRKTPLNMLSKSVRYGGVSISFRSPHMIGRPHFTATMVSLIDSARIELLDERFYPQHGIAFGIPCFNQL